MAFEYDEETMRRARNEMARKMIRDLHSAPRRKNVYKGKRFYLTRLHELQRELDSATSPLDVARLTEEIQDTKKTIRFLSYR